MVTARINGVLQYLGSPEERVWAFTPDHAYAVPFATMEGMVAALSRVSAMELMQCDEITLSLDPAERQEAIEMGFANLTEDLLNDNS